MTLVDTLTLVETPEGIALRLRAAGMLPRAAAWVIDLAIRIGVLWVCAIGFALAGEFGMALNLILMFSLTWGYPVLFEVLRDGQTPGKMALGLRVVNANGTPVGWVASIVRNLMRTVDMLPILYGFGLVSGLIDRSSRRLGDIVAGTLVVHVEPAHGHSAAPVVPAVPSPLPLPAAEQGAIVAFAERSRQLTPERQRELAELLPQLTQARGAVAVQRLLGLANSFLGRD
ncbi:RDD family protein [Tahibacter harae]|uniref:RDD family protein n=1 Tax=Tahibacter harae TaxID=2963937 RepID=UPI003F6DE416